MITESKGNQFSTNHIVTIIIHISGGSEPKFIKDSGTDSNRDTDRDNLALQSREIQIEKEIYRETESE